MEMQNFQTEQEKIKKTKNSWLMLICWLAYTSAYLGRYSYNSNITPIIDCFGISYAQAGTVTTFFFFAYGAGQIINGIFCKYYPKRITICSVLIVSSMMNLAVYFGVPFTYVKYLWLINGIVQSMLWPTLIFVLSENLNEREMRKAVVVMSTSVAAGTLVSYGLSALFSFSAKSGFRYSFIVGASVMFFVGICWFLFYSRLTDKKEDCTIKTEEKKQTPKSDKSVVWTIAVLGLMAIINNLVKDGLSIWLPSILKDKYGFNDSLSILLTLVLPILGMFGTVFAVNLGKKIKSFISLTGVMFLFSVIGLLFSIFFLDTKFWLAVLILFGLISLFMYGVNNVITSMAPLYMREKTNPGMAAGILNGCCYVGSTVSSYGLGVIADTWGWNGVCYCLLAISCVPLVLTVLFRRFTARKAEKSGR